LIYIGSLHHERNLLPLSRAVVRAREEGLNLHLTLVGDGSERSQLEGFARAHTDAVVVRPPVPHAQVPGLLAEADVGVLPFPDELKFRVSSPIKLFEYLAAGLPVLTTDLPFMHEILGGHACVFWARGSDEAALLTALREIAAAQDRLPELGRQTTGIAAQWTWERAALKLKQALMVGLQRAKSERAHHRSEAKQT
jgi:glycosyltransferase involved in cell wall biosynthesis